MEEYLHDCMFGVMVLINHILWSYIRCKFTDRCLLTEYKVFSNLNKTLVEKSPQLIHVSSTTHFWSQADLIIDLFRTACKNNFLAFSVHY